MYDYDHDDDDNKIYDKSMMMMMNSNQNEKCVYFFCWSHSYFFGRIVKCQWMMMMMMMNNREKKRMKEKKKGKHQRKGEFTREFMIHIQTTQTNILFKSIFCFVLLWKKNPNNRVDMFNQKKNANSFLSSIIGCQQLNSEW